MAIAQLFRVPNLIKAIATRETTAMTFLPYGQGRWPLQREYDPTEAYLQGWNTCVWIFACVSRIAQCVSSLSWTVKERQEGKWKTIPSGHDYEQLIEYPTQKSISRKTLMTLAVQHLLLPGEFFWKKITVGKRVDELWPVNPLIVDPVISSGEWISKYKLRRGLATIGEDIPAESMVHGLYVNPERPFRGHSPFRALRETVAMDNDQVTWNRNLPRNGNVPKGVFVDPNLTTPEQLNETKDYLLARSGPQFAGEPLVLGGQAKWERMALSPQEVDWLNTAKMTIHRVCAAYNIPPAIIIPETASTGLNNSNLPESIKYLWVHSSLPVADMIEEALNLSLFQTRDERKKFWIHYDTSGIAAMQEKLKDQLEAISEGVKNGIRLNDMISLTEVAVEPQPGGDQPVRASSLIEIDFSPDEPGANEDRL